MGHWSGWSCVLLSEETNDANGLRRAFAKKGVTLALTAAQIHQHLWIMKKWKSTRRVSEGNEAFLESRKKSSTRGGWRRLFDFLPFHVRCSVNSALRRPGATATATDKTLPLADNASDKDPGGA
jgi:hypothetical protein